MNLFDTSKIYSKYLFDFNLFNNDTLVDLNYKLFINLTNINVINISITRLIQIINLNLLFTVDKIYLPQYNEETLSL